MVRNLVIRRKFNQRSLTDNLPLTRHKLQKKNERTWMANYLHLLTVQYHDIFTN